MSCRPARSILLVALLAGCAPHVPDHRPVATAPPETAQLEAEAERLRAVAADRARAAADARAWELAVEQWTSLPDQAAPSDLAPPPRASGGIDALRAEIAALLELIEQKRCAIAQSLEEISTAQQRIDRARSAARAGEVPFASGSAEVEPAAREALRELADVARAMPGARFHVAGHADRQPIRSARFASNHALSEARARAVVEILVAEGIDEDRLSFAGYADTVPRAGGPNDRRVEIHLVPPESVP